MRQWTNIISSSFRMAMLELWKAKLRTLLSLFGITIGVFSIIGVLTTIDSLEQNLQTEIRSLGTNTIYIDKWQYSTGPDNSYWKHARRPPPRYGEMAELKARTPTAGHIAFKISAAGTVEGGSSIAANVRYYGVSEAFAIIQPLEIFAGRYLTSDEFYRGTNTVVAGYTLAENLFGDAALAVHKTIVFRGQQARIVGVTNKQGSQLIGGWGFDQSVVMPYRYARTLMDERKADPLILVQGKSGTDSKVLLDDLNGSMRAVRKLRPTEEENFALNDVADFSAVMSTVFDSVNLGGWIIGALALIVGIFGVANIMFVTVTERTPQIGLKKALGAKRRTILTEFLLEAAFLCILGGLIGLLLVFGLTKIATAILQFPIFLSAGTIALAVFICLAAGVLAGMIPAIKAAKMNPIDAIRR